MADQDEDHALSDFLSQRLPQVGLDYDTYGPYVLPLLTDQEVDEEEWDGVLELLQASSESHSDDDDTWTTLRADIQAAWAQHLAQTQQVEHAQKLEREQELAEALAEERRIAAQAAEEAAHAVPKTAESDAAKQALMARFGYEDDDTTMENDGTPLTNHQVAAQAAHEKTQELRANKGGASKKEEQSKTAQAKKDKAQLKEERRKRTTKNERRRN